MLGLLDPRVWGAMLLALALSSGAAFFYGEHKQKHFDELEKVAEIATSNQEARKNENKRQDNVDAAAQVEAIRSKQLLADASNARGQRDGLLNDLNALQRASEKSLTSSVAALGLTTQLFDRCTDRYIGVAEAAKRADTEARELRQGWPK